MTESFLEICRINTDEESDKLAFLEKYYKSVALAREIENLLYSRLETRNIAGKNILLKPNWVRHSVRHTDEICLRTNDNVVISVLTSVLKMKPASVVIGDAPIQGCKWNLMLSDGFLNTVKDLSMQYDTPVRIEDFRRRIYYLSKNNLLSEIRPITDYLIFDVGIRSKLEPVTSADSKFRVNNYDPDRMKTVHAPGKHMYCLSREFFEADVVIQLPKIKTHQKTGITGALKNIVGINGDKDFLPHHRMGGTVNGGDCYPGGSLLRYSSELTMDKANRRQGKVSYWIWQKFSSFLWKVSLPGPLHNVDAGWYGNDTCWRMVSDLNLIAMYGKTDGTFSEEPQRQIYSLSDAIVAGQGDGPLEPLPLPMGIISFSNDSLCHDMAMALLMDLPVEKLPILKDNLNGTINKCHIRVNGVNTRFEDLRKFSVRAKPPKGWIAHLNHIK